MFHSVLRDIGSFNLGVAGANNNLGANIGGEEKAAAGLVMGVSQAPLDALGFDYNGDGRGAGYNVPSLLGINAVPPYYHNGACETLACVVDNPKHRTANGTIPDRLGNPADRGARRGLPALDQRRDAADPLVPARRGVRVRHRARRYPFVLAPAVVDKLRLVHDLISPAGRSEHRVSRE